MLKSNLHSKILVGLLALSSFSACKKSNNIGQDNDTVISTPHTVLAGTPDGWMVKTNDGRDFSQVFPPDGAPIKMISSAGPNVLMLKSSLFLSDNNGRNFNPITYNNYNVKPWRYWVMDCASHNRTYMSANSNYGVVYSEDSGRTWNEDQNWAANTAVNLRMTSFAEINNGAVFAFNDEYNVLFRRDGKEGAWTPVTIVGEFPAASAFYLTSNKTDLYIVDYNGLGGAWYSQDEGVTWKQFGNGIIPTNGQEKFVGAASIGSASLAVATEKNVYFANAGVGFTLANTGLKAGTKIHGITAKYNKYKNGSYSDFLYIATSDGIYRSDDHGFSWDKVSFNEFDNEYIAIY